MSVKDFEDYFSENWKQFEESITEISKNDSRDPLVRSDIKAYNFDKISAELLKKKPTSVDAIMIKSTCIEFIEFKGGFKRKINIRDINLENTNACIKSERYCRICDNVKEYFKLFENLRKKEEKELRSSIQMKAVESFVTWHKQIIQRLPEECASVPIELTVVIDDQGIDSMENDLMELAELAHPNENPNVFNDIKKSLSRFVGLNDAKGSEYYFKSCNVVSAGHFLNRLQGASNTFCDGAPQ